MFDSSFLRFPQTLQCIALIISNSHPAQVPRSAGTPPSLQVAQLPTALRRIQALSSPALQSLYASGMFSNERQNHPLDTCYAARSTLVVMPASILHQWEKELKDWAPFLDVFIFQGSHVHKHPDVVISKLLTCDVALISCTHSHAALAHTPPPSHTCPPGSTLEKEYWRTGHDKDLRGTASARDPSPIFRIYFWRIMLDETQYIDKSNNKTKLAAANTVPKSMRFKVAMCVHSAHRWCVSGTPFSTIDDLKTLLVFLRHDLGSRAAWDAVCAGPRMTDPSFWQSVLHLWRNSRSSTARFVALPDTANLVLVTSMSSVERELYRTCLASACAGSDDRRQSLIADSDQDDGSKLSDLLRACVHPSQLSDHCMKRLGIDVSRCRYKPTKNKKSARDQTDSHASSLHSMAELMKRLVSQADEDLEEARLEWYIAMNDLADHASFNCQDNARACDLYAKGFELSQDTVVSYPHKAWLESM